jgi:hypothetical protein
MNDPRLLNDSGMAEALEPVRKRFPRFGTGSFLTKHKKTEKKYDFSCPE